MPPLLRTAQHLALAATTVQSADSSVVSFKPGKAVEVYALDTFYESCRPQQEGLSAAVGRMKAADAQSELPAHASSRGGGLLELYNAWHCALVV